MTSTLNRRDYCTGTGTVATMKCVLSINAILAYSDPCIADVSLFMYFFVSVTWLGA